MKKNTLFIILFALLLISLFIDNFVAVSLSKLTTPWLTTIMKAITIIGDTFAVIFISLIIIAYIIILKKEKKYLPAMFIALLVSSAIVYILKILVHRQRPYEALKIPSLEVDKDFSFPSGHTNAVFSIIPSINKMFRKFSIVWLVFAILVDISRLYLGAHYLSDVFFSVILGLGMGYLLIDLENRYNLSKIFRKDRR